MELMEPRPLPRLRPRRRQSLLSVGALLAALGCVDAPPHPATADATASLGSGPLALGQIPTAELPAAIRERILDAPRPELAARTIAERTELRMLYEAEAFTAVWVDRQGRPLPRAREARDVLDAARGDGLDPADYDAGALSGLAPRLAAGDASLDDLAAFDLTLSAAMLRYFRHLHLGRVDPRSIGVDLTIPLDQHDFVLVLRTALAEGRVAATAAEMAPPLVQYQALRAKLSEYRSLAADRRLASTPAPLPTVRPGDPHPGLVDLRHRLIAFRDLPPDTPAPGDLYDEPFVAGVKRFQERHGLDADGIIGTATQAALQVPVSWRVRQIELALERLRWLPDLGDQPFVELNIPMFQLWAWDSILPSGVPAFGMRAIVGRALRTQTPVFVEDMKYVIFHPYWNVPPGILRNEIVPLLARDPGYLDKHDMEIVRGPGDDARPVPATAENIAQLGSGLRVRQRPGPHNALGLVKFVFPNDENVYLHGTPARQLFSRARRDFSHGCVRVEDPVALAEWVLKHQTEWTRERIVAAMSGPRPQRVDLTRPIPVILFYVTAVVMPEDGTLRFAADIYQHDERLDRALARPRPSE